MPWSASPNAFYTAMKFRGRILYQDRFLTKERDLPRFVSHMFMSDGQHEMTKNFCSTLSRNAVKPFHSRLCGDFDPGVHSSPSHGPSASTGKILIEGTNGAAKPLSVWGKGALSPDALSSNTHESRYSESGDRFSTSKYRCSWSSRVSHNLRLPPNAAFRSRCDRGKSRPNAALQDFIQVDISTAEISSMNSEISGATFPNSLR